MKIHGFICTRRTYNYKGWEFEWGAYQGPWPLRKDGELRKRAGRVFWRICDEFAKLTDEEKEKHRTDGGCEPF